MANPSGSIDLGDLFQSVMNTLSQNRENLNQADTHNHDHGSNMVNTFQLITRAINEKKDGTPAEQLAFAAEILKTQKNGSAQLYARGLDQAARQFQGRDVTVDDAPLLIQSILGVGEVSAQQSGQVMIMPADGAYVSSNTISFKWNEVAGATRYWLVVKRTKDGSTRVSKDLGKALSSDEPGFGNDGTQYKWTVGINDEPDESATYWTFTNGPYVPPPQQTRQPVQQQQEPGINDIIGTLIRKAQQPQKQQQAKADATVGPETIVDAIVSNSAVGGSYRSQSGSLVANALISAIQNMTNRK